MLLSNTYLHRVPARRPRNQANADTSYISLACVSELLRYYHFPLKLSLIWRIEVVFNNVVGATIKPASVSLSIHLCITILCETRCGYMEGSYLDSRNSATSLNKTLLSYEQSKGPTRLKECRQRSSPRTTTVSTFKTFSNLRRTVTLGRSFLFIDCLY